MSDTPQEGASAQMAREPDPAPDPPPGLVSLSDLIPGYGQQGHRRIRVESRSGAVAFALFEQPGGIVKQYDDKLFGLKKGNGDSWTAAEHVIRTRFVDFENVDMPADLKARHGTWKTALLREPALRPLAEAAVSAYVASVRVKAAADEPDED